MKTSKPLLTLRMLFPAAASFIVLLLGEWIARGSLTADTFISLLRWAWPFWAVRPAQ